MPLIPVKYAPKNLTKKDKKKAIKELKKSRKLYKKGKYYTRKKDKSFKSKVSPLAIVTASNSQSPVSVIVTPSPPVVISGS